MNAHFATGILAGVMLLSAEASGAQPKVPVILDTDIGTDLDDVFALALVLASPELELRAVTTVSGDAYTRARLVCRLLQAVGRTEVPVASGQPPRPTPERSGQLPYGLQPGVNKSPEAELAVPLLYRQFQNRPGELTLLAIGPLTNVAELLNRYPECKPWIKRIVLMGGAIRIGYNGKPPVEAEWNIRSDIKAAQEVFRAGVPLLVAPLDATSNLPLEARHRQRIFQAGTPLTQQVQALCQLSHKATPVLYDPVAVTLCFEERFCRMEALRLEVDAQGITQVVPGKANTRVALSIRAEEFLSWYVERLASVPPGSRPPPSPR